MECWASQLGDCKGPQSGEHYFSKALFSEKTVYVKGFNWCKTEHMTIPLSRARANILCKRHNELLSQADSEALRFQTAIREISSRPRFTRNGRLRKPPRRHVVSGQYLARWLTKTYCNLMAVAKRHVDDNFVLYSFGRPTIRKLHVYMHVYKGAKWEPRLEHLTVQDYFDDAREDKLWHVMLAGLPWLVSNIDLRDLGTAFVVGEHALPVRDFLENPAEITLDYNVAAAVGGIVHFDW